MRIAQIAPLIESCPPRLYGGTERIVAYLTEELVRLGHEVTLFASGDSVTSARLVPCSRSALRQDPAVIDPLPHYMLMLDRVRRAAHTFDILHFHIDVLHHPLMREIAPRTLTTLHGRLDLPDLLAFYAAFRQAPLASISFDQRRPMPPVNWVGTVPHGLPRDLLPFRERADGGYLAFLGRISPEKGPDRAIEIAERAGLPLRIAAKIDRADKPYWDQVIAPMLRERPQVEFLGEIGEADKAEFLGGARALLFPIDWPEPFGMVMIEAMSCGTPVIAFRRGSVPEVIDDGVSGLVVETIDEAVAATRRVGELDRRRVRRCFEQRFTLERMTGAYLDIYGRLLARAPARHRKNPAPAKRAREHPLAACP